MSKTDPLPQRAWPRSKGQEGGITMPDVTLVYWRDIPAQIIVGRGRNAVKFQLSQRFELAIDRAAMASGAAGSDAYLAAWRRAAPHEMTGDAAEIAAREAARLEAEYDMPRLRDLIANGGHAPSTLP